MERENKKNKLELILTIASATIGASLIIASYVVGTYSEPGKMDEMCNLSYALGASSIPFFGYLGMRVLHRFNL